MVPSGGIVKSLVIGSIWVKTVALHGVESVGKSTLARQLAERLGTQWVSEYGRAHCEVHGTDVHQAGLQLIAAAHQAQKAVRRFNGTKGTWFCGAWMKNGFHEDGIASAVDVAEAISVRRRMGVAAR